MGCIGSQVGYGRGFVPCASVMQMGADFWKLVG